MEEVTEDAVATARIRAAGEALVSMMDTATRYGRTARTMHDWTGRYRVTVVPLSRSEKHDDGGAPDD
jgi:hypothetical protein